MHNMKNTSRKAVCVAMFMTRLKWLGGMGKSCRMNALGQQEYKDTLGVNQTWRQSIRKEQICETLDRNGPVDSIDAVLAETWWNRRI